MTFIKEMSQLANINDSIFKIGFFLLLQLTSIYVQIMLIKANAHINKLAQYIHDG
jgi:hypothetical protein